MGEGTSGSSNVQVAVLDGDLQLEGGQESTESMNPTRVVHPLYMNERRRSAQNKGNRDPKPEVIPYHWRGLIEDTEGGNPWAHLSTWAPQQTNDPSAYYAELTSV